MKKRIIVIRRIISSIYFKLFATALICYYLYTLIDVNLLAGSFLKVRLGLLPVLVVLFLVFWFFNILSLYVLLTPLGHITFREFYRYQLKSTLLGSVTPMETGEAVIFVYLQNRGFHFQKVLASFLLNKVVHLLLLICSGIYFLYYLHMTYIPILLACASGILLLCLMIINSKSRIYIRENIVKRFIPSYYDFFELTSDYFRKHNRYLLWNIAINLLKIMIGGLAIWVDFKMFSIHIDFLLLLSVFNISRVISLLPISFGGIGILEGGVALALSKIGFDYSQVILAMFFERFVGIALTVVVFPILYFRKQLSKEDKG